MSSASQRSVRNPNGVKMKVDLAEVERAFVKGFISIEDFVKIQVENFGKKKTRQILRRNLGIRPGSPEDLVIKRLTS